MKIELVLTEERTSRGQVVPAGTVLAEVHPVKGIDPVLILKVTAPGRASPTFLVREQAADLAKK